jgi:4-amino-4-deoxy-L-arabinose transferase-like glycosyltransferase
MPPVEPGRRRWWLRLAGTCAIALVLRVAYVFLLRQPGRLSFDAYQYHRGANLLVDGKGFVSAFAYDRMRALQPTAQHPPLYTLALAVASAVGLRSVLAHQLWSCLIGTATVALLGLLGRRVAGPRAGLVAAYIGAIYPNLWVSDGLVMSETLMAAVTAATLLAAYRFWDRRSGGAAVALGACCALAALARGEAILFLPVVAVPLIMLARPLARSRRLALAMVAAATTVVVLVPWIGFNLARFERPVLVTDGFDLALFTANCDLTYYGADVGRSSSCPPPSGSRSSDQPVDESVGFAAYRRTALDYVGEHWRRVPWVAFVRVARVAGGWNPLQQVRLDTQDDLRDLAVARLGLAFWVVLAPAAVAGVVIVRRRRVPIWPMLGVVLVMVGAVVVTSGLTRYRVVAEPVVVVLAAVAVDALWRMPARGTPAPVDVGAGDAPPVAAR